MKKIKLNGKLSLNKETILQLNKEQMNKINGGLFSIVQCMFENTNNPQNTELYGCNPPSSPAATCFPPNTEAYSQCVTRCNGRVC